MLYKYIKIFFSFFNLKNFIKHINLYILNKLI